MSLRLSTLFTTYTQLKTKYT